MHVAVHFRSSAAEAKETCELVESAGGSARAFAADLADRAQARGLVDAVIAEFGGLDLLVPSAANFERVPLGTLDDADWDRTLELDLTSPFVLAQRASSALRAARGSIVFITCASATTPFKNYLPYVVAKGALRQLMRTLALELAPDVRVNAVAPGTVLPPTELGSAVVGRLAHSVPLQRIGSSEDVAEAVVYLAGAEFVTGQELLVDGGRGVARVERFE
jgi:pteridine reductase